MSHRKKIAFIGVGIFGAPGKSPTMPALIVLLNNLSAVYDITVYRLSIGEIQKPGFRVRSLPFSFLSNRINFIFIMLLFAWDHLRRRFVVINALSVVPAGRIAVALSKIFNIPVVLHLHAAEAIAIHERKYGDIRDSKAAQLTQRLCDDMALITVLSQFHKEAIEKNIRLSKPVEIINHGCNTQLFSFQPKKIEGTLRILFIGYDEPVKDPVAAMKVFSAIEEKTNTTLTVIGRGLTENRFAAENIPTRNVIFREGLTHAEIKEALQLHDILLITSFYESQSAVAIEAMACGVLVCGTHVGVLADLSGIACETVPVDESELLAEKIISLSQNPERQNQLRVNGRKWAEEHDHLWTAMRYSQIFESIR